MVRMHGTENERPFRVEIKVPGELKFQERVVMANSILEANFKAREIAQSVPGSKVFRVNLANFLQ